MRVSVRKDDPGYRPDAFLFRVFLDGLELRGCFTADEERGEAHCYVEDERGRTVPDPQNPKRALEVVNRGRVEIRPPEAA